MFANASIAQQEMKDQFITSLDDKLITAELAITKTMRMMQILSGFVKDEEGNEISETGKVNMFQYFASIDRSEVVRYPKNKIAKFEDGGDHVKVFCPVVTKGSDLLIPGQYFSTKTPIGTRVSQRRSRVRTLANLRRSGDRWIGDRKP